MQVEVWIGLTITRLLLALTYNDTISWTHLRLSEKGLPFSSPSVVSLFARTHSLPLCLQAIWVAWPFHPPTKKLLVFSYVIVLLTWWEYKCLCVCRCNRDEVRLRRCICMWMCSCVSLYETSHVCVCVCYDCYCYSDVSLMQTPLPNLFINICEKNQGKTEQTVKQQNNPVLTLSTLVTVFHLSVRLCCMSTYIQDPLGGRNWDDKRGRKCCLNPSINLNLVYLALFVLTLDKKCRVKLKTRCFS